MERLAIIQVRGTIGANRPIIDTLRSLRLHRQNYCTIVPKTPEYSGMLQTAKDFITWGEIDEATYKALTEKRGEEVKDSDAKGKGIKKFFRLNPPQKGYGRKGTKKAFSDGGALGYRGAKINDLLLRMI
jgi:large subunit ribosomal protein L30